MSTTHFYFAAITLCLGTTLANAQTPQQQFWQQRQQYDNLVTQSQLDQLLSQQAYDRARQIDRINQLRQQRLLYGFPPLLGDPD